MPSQHVKSFTVDSIRPEVITVELQLELPSGKPGVSISLALTATQARQLSDALAFLLE